MSAEQLLQPVPLEAASPFELRVGLGRGVPESFVKKALVTGNMGFLHSFTTGSTVDGPGVRVVRAPCVGRCDTAPAAEVGHNFVDHATVANVLATAKAGDTHAHLPDYIGYEKYVAGGGYKLLKRLRSGELSKDDLLKALDDSSLRGLGGAGFPTLSVARRSL